MKLSVDQRTKFFNLIRTRVIKNKEKIKVVSSDHPNKSLIYEDDDYYITLFYNIYGIGVSTNEAMMISVHDKKSNTFVNFDSGDYMIIKNSKDYYNLVREVNYYIFDKDTHNNTNKTDIDKILKNF